MKNKIAGRPKEENPKDIQLSIRFTNDENKQIEELAEKIGMSKAKLIRSIVLGNIDDVKFLQNIGSLPLIQKYKKFVASL
ncbi:MAG: hypothetical protein COB42_06520 [Sulfurimonas sp.]|nr:MAG: hypothetical protein COB42_06520 [Sulfurimonas sp.]